MKIRDKSKNENWKDREREREHFDSRKNPKKGTVM